MADRVCLFQSVGFCKVLSQLTQVGDVTPEQFISKSWPDFCPLKATEANCANAIWDFEYTIWSLVHYVILYTVYYFMKDCRK